MKLNPTQKKIIFISMPIVLLILVFSVFQGKIFKVSAQIVPVTVNADHLTFGTVFPGEELQKDFIVSYADTGDGINYKIIQKPKPCPTENPNCGPDGYYKNLCPYLEKVSNEGEGDTENLAFVGPNDPSDTWIIYFKVPAIFGNVAQDHTGGVVNEEGDYGCDIAIDIDINELCKADVELLTNGGFETPLVTHVSGWDIFPSGYSGLGWNVQWYDGYTPYMGVNRPTIANAELHKSGNLPDTNDIPSSWLAQSGSQYTELDSDWNGHVGSLNNEPASIRIYQDIPTLSGVTYTLKYAWSPRPGRSDNVIEVYWDGNLVATHSGSGGSGTNWTLETKTGLTTTTNLTRVEIIEKGIPDSYGMFLDAASLRCIPPLISP